MLFLGKEMRHMTKIGKKLAAVLLAVAMIVVSITVDLDGISLDQGY